MSNSDYALLPTLELIEVMAKCRSDFRSIDLPPSQLARHAKSICDIRTILAGRNREEALSDAEHVSSS